MLTFKFTQVNGTMSEADTLTSGMVGKQCKLEFSDDWAEYQKTAVFTAGSITRDVVNVENVVEIPAECLARPMVRLHVGVYGIAEDGRRTPTINVPGPYILPGADPSGDESTNPELPVWAQILAELEGLKNNGPSGSVSVEIGENGNWIINGVDTGRPSRGEAGEQGEPGMDCVRPDLAQNDETAPNYVKGRTHWVEDLGIVERELLPERTFESEDDDVGYWEFKVDTFPMEIGVTYVVIFDGTTYECVARSYKGRDDMSAIGDSTKSRWSDNDGIRGNEEPFYIFCEIEYNYFYACTPTPGTHTLRIVRKKQEFEYHTIPEDYLPESVTTKIQPDWNQNDPKAPDYIANRPFYTGVPIPIEYLPSQICPLVVHDDDGIAVYYSGRSYEPAHAAMLYYYATEGATVVVSGNDGTIYYPYSQIVDEDNNYYTVCTFAAIVDGEIRYCHVDSDCKIEYSTEKRLILASSTPGSTKKFAISVTDDGTITATEVST